MNQYPNGFPEKTLMEVNPVESIALGAIGIGDTLHGVAEKIRQDGNLDEAFYMMNSALDCLRHGMAYICDTKAHNTALDALWKGDVR